MKSIKKIISAALLAAFVIPSVAFGIDYYTVRTQDEFGRDIEDIVAALTASIALKMALPSGTTAQYMRGDGTLATLPASGSGTVTSVGLSSTDFSVSGSPVTASSSITANLNTVGTAGTYSGVTTDSKGRVTAGTNRSQASSSRSLNTCFQVSSTRDSLVNYSVDIATTLSLTGGQTGTVFLETYSNGSCTTGIQELSRSVNGNTGTLTIGLNITQNVTGGLNGFIPAGAYAQLRTANTVGTPTFNYRSGQEVLM